MHGVVLIVEAQTSVLLCSDKCRYRVIVGTSLTRQSISVDISAK